MAGMQKKTLAQPDEAWQARAARGAADGDSFRDSFQVMAWHGTRPPRLFR